MEQVPVTCLFAVNRSHKSHMFAFQSEVDHERLDFTVLHSHMQHFGFLWQPKRSPRRCFLILR